MLIKKFGIGVASVAIALSISACSLTTPSQVEIENLKVKEGYMTSTVMRDEIDAQYWGAIADDYMRNSSGPVNLYVSYPTGVTGANVQASRLARQYEAALMNRGVEAVNSEIVPIENVDHANRVIVSFKNLKAELPEKCPKITGSNGSETLYDIREYKFGCENMKYTAKMVSDPADLLGRSITRDADSRRAGAVVERYRTGDEFDALESSAASNVN